MGSIVLELAFLSLVAICSAQQPGTINPLQGQGVTPDYDNVTGSFTQPDVDVQLALERLWEVNQDAFTFKVSFWLFLEWEDERAAPLIAGSRSLDGCKKPCSSNPLPARCCDKVYIPNIKFANLASVNRDVPMEYSLVAVDNTTTVAYSIRIFGSFLARNMNFASYPFDRHHLTIDMSTDFIAKGSPSAQQAANYIVIKGKKLGPDEEEVDASGQNVPEGLGWRVDGVSFAPTSLLTSFSGGNKKSIDPSNSYADPGMQFTIDVARTTKSFYTVLIIIPPCLVVLMSFSTFINPPSTPDLRLKTLGTAFLTLNIFFYTTLKVLPGTYALIAPHWLLLVSLVTIFLMTIETLIATHIVKRGDFNAEAKKWEEFKAGGDVKKNGGEEAVLMDDDMKLGSEVFDTSTKAQTNVVTKKPSAIRRLRDWWHYLGEKDNQPYRDHIATVFERTAVPILLSGYVVAVAVIFATASLRPSSSW